MYQPVVTPGPIDHNAPARMLRLVVGALVGFLFSAGWAQTPGDAGTAECRRVQLAAQTAVLGAVSAPRNHGELMRMVTRITSPEREVGHITEACESCIVSQFARRVPISNQNPCGPDLPTCPGFGAETPGGSGQPPFVVTNLNDSGSGSLREAVSTGHRYITFAVGGTIELRSRLLILKPFVTIDGDSAPWPGITLSGSPKDGVVIHGTPRSYAGAEAHDIVIRNIRVRDSAGDNFQIGWGAYNVVLGHVSSSGAGDGNVDITHGAHDATVCWSLIGPSLVSKNSLIKTQTADSPADTGRITLHHNLITQSKFRNPRISYDRPGGPPEISDDRPVDMVNNLVTHWSTGMATDVECGMKANLVNNFYTSPGSPDSDQLQGIVVRPANYSGCNHTTAPGYAYTSGNFSADLLDNGQTIGFSINCPSANCPAGQPVPYPAPPVTPTTACQAALNVLAGAGAQPRDAVDQGIISAITPPTCP